MPKVSIREGESFDMGLRRFRRICEKEGIMSEYRTRANYIKPTEVRRRKAELAKVRAKKLNRVSRIQTTGSRRRTGFFGRKPVLLNEQENTIPESLNVEKNAENSVEQTTILPAPTTIEPETTSPAAIE